MCRLVSKNALYVCTIIAFLAFHCVMGVYVFRSYCIVATTFQTLLKSLRRNLSARHPPSQHISSRSRWCGWLSYRFWRPPRVHAGTTSLEDETSTSALTSWRGTWPPAFPSTPTTPSSSRHTASTSDLIISFNTHTRRILIVIGTTLTLLRTLGLQVTVYSALCVYSFVTAVTRSPFAVSETNWEQEQEFSSCK